MSGRPRRLLPDQYVGQQQYFLTLCTHARRRYFLGDDAVMLVHSHLLRAAEAERFGILAYCFMPDHVHAVVEGNAISCDLQRLVARAKQGSGFAFARAFSRRLWQPGVFDRTIRETEDALGAIEYVIHNPVRAHIVASPADYPYWGSQVYAREHLLEALSARAKGRRG